MSSLHRPHRHARGWSSTTSPLLTTRGVFGALAVMTYFYSIDHTTLGRAVFFQFTYPAWGALFSTLFLKEHMGWNRVPALAADVSSARSLILAFPGSGEPAGDHSRGDIAGLLCGFFSGAAVTAIRGPSPLRHDLDDLPLLRVVRDDARRRDALSAAGTYVAPTPAEWALLAGIAATGTAAQITLHRQLPLPRRHRRRLDRHDAGAAIRLRGVPVARRSAFAAGACRRRPRPLRRSRSRCHLARYRGSPGVTGGPFSRCPAAPRRL